MQAARPTGRQEPGRARRRARRPAPVTSAPRTSSMCTASSQTEYRDRSSCLRAYSRRPLFEDRREGYDLSMWRGVLGVSVLALFSCSGSAPQRSATPPTAAVTSAHPGPDSRLICPAASSKLVLWLEAAASPAIRGYRRLDSDVAVQTLRTAISDSKPRTTAPSDRDPRKPTEVLAAALADLKPELQDCIRRADPIVPDLQYTLRVSLSGALGVATIIDHVEFLRIDSGNGRESIDVKTSAEACVAGILTRLELPAREGHF
jgi:hypothetical protein